MFHALSFLSATEILDANKTIKHDMLLLPSTTLDTSLCYMCILIHVQSYFAEHYSSFINLPENKSYFEYMILVKLFT